MINLIKNLDLLSFKENIKVESKSMYSTLIGGILSIIMIIIYIASSFYYISDQWTRNKSFISVSTKRFENSTSKRLR